MTGFFFKLPICFYVLSDCCIFIEPCSTCGGTAEEKMEFVRWLVVKFLDFHEKETWFSDNLNYSMPTLNCFIIDLPTFL